MKRIYYRGKLDSCNYTCSYCPFGKKSSMPNSTAQDEQAWQRFVTAIEQWQGEPLQLFIIPYGEALIHRYYREGIKRLAALPHVIGVSCQTNLSFPAVRWLDELQASPALISKIKVWASFHPEMTTVDKFVQQLHILHGAEMDVCAGAVGNPSAKEILAELRHTLSPDIYLFINAMQGLKRPLSEEEILFFTQLDNLFEYDLQNAPAQYPLCSGGRDSCFVDWKGDIYACPRSHVRIGNLYEGMMQPTPTSCNRTVCDCYIAFSNLNHHPLHSVMGAGTFWRIPDKSHIQAAFFDIDGTLTDACGQVPDSYADALRHMAQSTSLFLATSLSIDQARRKLGSSLFRLFKGGVFAGGGLISYGGRVECHPIDALPNDCRATRITSLSHQGETYKYSMLIPDKEKREAMIASLKSTPYYIYTKGPLITIIHPDASKEEGVRRICAARQLPLAQVLVVGNSADDWGMMSLVPHSCAVLRADPLLKERARYVLNPDRLPAFFR